MLYSGTVAAAIEGAFFEITSMAVSLEYDEHAEFDKAARLAPRHDPPDSRAKRPGAAAVQLQHPDRARWPARRAVRIVPMDVARYGEQFEKRLDPRGRSYYWLAGGKTRPAK